MPVVSTVGADNLSFYLIWQTGLSPLQQFVGCVCVDEIVVRTCAWSLFLTCVRVGWVYQSFTYVPARINWTREGRRRTGIEWDK